MAAEVAYKKIKLRKQSSKEAKQIQEHFQTSDIASRILAARGFTLGDELKNYINPTLKEGLPDPALLVGLEQACELLARSAEHSKGIAIACDFDVDGLSGGAQLYDFLKCCGIPASIFVPDRFSDGYGLNERIVRAIAEQGIKTLVTIDYGTTNIKEIALARELGIQTVVVDHHHVGAERSQPDVFINPNQIGCGFADKVLSASGLCWYLLVGLRKALKKENIEVKNYLDLACLGTICDMVPLTGANRVIAKRGLEMLRGTTRTGLIALKNVIGIKGDVNCHDVGFGIGPRLNAAGRMVHGDVVIDLLTTNDSEKASRLAGRLNKLNLERQDTENLVKTEAIKTVMESGTIDSALVVWNKDFHTGVIGIVAQRLVENFYRPAVVMGVDSDGMLKGSVRGIKGFSVVEALASVGNTLTKFGGHDGAGGLTVSPENLECFIKEFKEECSKRLESIETSPYTEADTVVGLEELNADLVQELGLFSPFGMGNPAPILFSKKLNVVEVKVLKNTHIKTKFTDGKRYLSGLLWRLNRHPALEPGACVNVAYRLDTNSYGGFMELQANIQAIEKA